LPAVNVARPGRWGDKVARRLALATGRVAVAAFKSWLENEPSDRWNEVARLAVRGKDLACWRPMDAPFHAEVLLAFAKWREPGSDFSSPGVADANLSCGSSR
jgi:Domain of unknown function (DUF4326)